MLGFHHVSKRFGAVRALEDVTFEIAPATIHVIAGENGTGESTLMKIAAGVHGPDSGALSLDGRDVTIAAPRQARQARQPGIALVPQEPALCPELSVSENLNLGQPPHRLGFVNREAGRECTVEALRRIALNVSPATPVLRLSSAQRYLLQIARGIAHEKRNWASKDFPCRFASTGFMFRLYVGKSLREYSHSCAERSKMHLFRQVALWV